MFDKARESTPPPYPLVPTLGLDIADRRSYGWGELLVTDDAISAYELDLAPDETRRGNIPPSEKDFTMEVLIAGPSELPVGHTAPVVSGTALYRYGSRTTLGLTADRDLFGLDLTNHTIDGITHSLPPEFVPEFLIDYGDHIQDRSKTFYPHAVAHTITNVTRAEAFSAYMTWKNIQDKRSVIRSLNRESMLYVGTAVVADTIDMAGDGDIEGAVGISNLVILGALALSATSHLKNELRTAPIRNRANAQVGMQIARRIAADIHGLLCPGKDAVA